MTKHRSFMYTQQEHFFICDNWKDEVARIVKNTQPLNWAAILHDKDLTDDGEPVEPHLHLMLYFKHARSIKSIAWEINDRVGKREDAKTERLEFFKNVNNGFSYLVHRTKEAANKFQYPVTDVISNFDFAQKIEHITQAVQRREEKSDRAFINELLDLLYTGDIDSDSMEELLTGSQYAKIHNKVKAVLDKRQERLNKTFSQTMKDQGKTKHIIYLFGQAGCGKTRLAKLYAEKASKPYFITGSSRDPFQNYHNQETVIIDELRPDTFPYDDLLKMLDPYNFDVFVPSRYQDKALTAETIIITSPYSPLELYKQAFKHSKSDSFNQLERRLQSTLCVTSRHHRTSGL